MLQVIGDKSSMFLLLVVSAAMCIFASNSAGWSPENQPARAFNLAGSPSCLIWNSNYYNSVASFDILLVGSSFDTRKSASSKIEILEICWQNSTGMFSLRQFFNREKIEVR